MVIMREVRCLAMALCMLGGVLLGVVEVVCNSISAVASYTTAIEFALLIIILLVRPIGLLGKKRRIKV